MMIGDHETHPLADTFPMMPGADLEHIVESMRARGFDPLEPVVRVDGLVLDGRNRLRAAAIAGVRPKFSDHALLPDGTGEGIGDIERFVVAKNLGRRHMNESARAMAAAKIATLRRGSASETGKSAGMRQGEAASLLNVSERLVRDARRVDERADPALAALASQGTIAVSEVAKLTRDEPALQRRVAQRVEEEVAKGKSPKLAAIVKQEKARAVTRRIEAEPPPMPLGPFRVIAVDVPWPYDSRPDDATQRGKLDYPPMSLEEIERFTAHEIESLVHPEGSVLHYWTTNAFLREALNILHRCGWRYRVTRVWDKVHMGLGNTYRNDVEFVIVATKGDAEIQVTNETTLFSEKRREHSQKPELFYSDVEATCPGSKVELFARTRRVGWTCWGAEVGKFAPVLDVGAASLAETEPAPAVACSDCEHPECPGVPDCSGCDVCTADALARDQAAPLGFVKCGGCWHCVDHTEWKATSGLNSAQHDHDADLPDIDQEWDLAIPKTCAGEPWLRARALNGTPVFGYASSGGWLRLNRAVGVSWGIDMREVDLEGSEWFTDLAAIEAEGARLGHDAMADALEQSGWTARATAPKAKKSKKKTTKKAAAR